MLHWIETHAVRAALAALAAAFLFYEFSALFFAYSADAYVATDVVVLAPEVAGPIAELHVRDDQRVAAGAPLLTIEPRPYAIAVEAARAALDLARQQQTLVADAVAQTEASIATNQARLTDAQAVLGRDKVLARQQFLAQQRLDDAQRDTAVAEAELRGAEAAAVVARQQVQVGGAQVAAAQAALDAREYDLSRTRIVAPAAGRVAPFQARVGDRASVGEPVLALATDADWRVIANVTERHLPRVVPGRTVLVMLGSDTWRVHLGKVRSVASAVSRSTSPIGVVPYVEPRTDWIRLPRRFPVEIDVPGLAERIPAFHGGNARVMVLF